MDRIDHMRIFVRVAQTRSFSKTAEELGLSRASVTTAIQLLERRLGVSLLHRTTRTVQLTVDGENMLERIIHLLHDFNELNVHTSQSNHQLSGHIRIEAPTRMARLLLIPSLPKFLAQHSQLHVEIRSTERMVNLIEQGVDLAIRVGDFKDKEMLLKPLGNVALINCASPIYIEKHGIPKSTQELSQHWVVQLASQHSGKIYPWEKLSGQEILVLHPPSRVTVNNAEAYIASAVAGMGLIQIPAYDVQTELSSGKLIQVLATDIIPMMPLQVVSPHVERWSSKLEIVVNWIQQLVQPICK